MSSTMRFNKDGKFKILMVSDIQETLNYDERTPVCLRKLVDHVKPDLMILGGDNCDGRKVKTREELRAYLDIFTRPMEETGTPWMHVYGNHDYDVDVPASEQSDIYGSYPHCVSGRSPEGVPGVSNYAIPVLAHDSDSVKYCIYAFDTHHKNAELRPGVTTEQLLALHDKYKPMRKWDIIRFEQQMWYWNLSKELEAKEGRLVPAMAVMHVVPHEAALTMKNPEETGLKGAADETLQCGVLNSGFFATALQRGDIDVIAAGHSHEDTIDAVYGGIRFCLDGCAGFSPYGIDNDRGGRVFEIDEDGNCNTYMVAYSEITDISK